MNIGKTIRQLRREKELTQEQLADYLNVSVSAVSQWELEKTAPDIGLLPALCSVLGVSADRLLGIDLAKKAEQIDAICKNADSYSMRGHLSEAEQILQDGLKTFPDSYKLLGNLMYIEFWYSDEAPSEAEHTAHLEKAIELGESILEGCIEDNLRHSVIQVLCFCYARKGMKERAKKLAQSLPFMCISSDFLLPSALDGSEKIWANQKKLYNLIQFLSNDIVSANLQKDDGEWLYNDEEQAALREKEIAFLHLMFEKGDFGFYHADLQRAHSYLASYAAGQKDAEGALGQLEQAADHAIAFLEYAADRLTHTSLLLKGYESVGAGFSTFSSDNNAAELLNQMQQERRYDFLREMPQFKAIEARLADFAAKWQPVQE